jgi:hypothetical protein
MRWTDYIVDWHQYNIYVYIVPLCNNCNYTVKYKNEVG